MKHVLHRANFFIIIFFWFIIFFFVHYAAPGVRRDVITTYKTLTRTRRANQLDGAPGPPGPPRQGRARSRHSDAVVDVGHSSMTFIEHSVPSSDDSSCSSVVVVDDTRLPGSRRYAMTGPY